MTWITDPIQKMQQVDNVFRLDADLMVCRACGRGIQMRHREKPLVHRHGCKHEAVAFNPWAVLAECLAETQASPLHAPEKD